MGPRDSVNSSNKQIKKVLLNQEAVPFITEVLIRLQQPMHNNKTARCTNQGLHRIVTTAREAEYFWLHKSGNRFGGPGCRCEKIPQLIRRAETERNIKVQGGD